MSDALNYHHLRCFVAVVEEGGLARAARRLHVTHPTVSEQIGKLEAALGIDLFDRQGRRLQLTESGRAVFDHAAQIFGIGAALEAVAEARRKGRGVLGRIGVDSVLARLDIGRILAAIRGAGNETMRLRCTADLREPLLTALQARRLDLVLSDAPADVFGSASIRSICLQTGRVALFAAPSLADTLTGDFPRCVDRAPFLLSMPGTRLRRELERWLGEHRIEPRVAAEVEDSALLKSLGEQGWGVFAMPARLAPAICAHYGVRVIGEIEEIEDRLFAIHRVDGRDHPVVRALAGIREGR